MATTMIFVLCSFVVGVSTDSVAFEAGRPFLGVSVSEKAELLCCYSDSNVQDLTWFVSYRDGNKTYAPLGVNDLKQRTTTHVIDQGHCGVLTLISVQPSDTGMYKCALNNTNPTSMSPGTYLQVYKPLEKTLNLRESTKNKILTVEGILLLLSVVLPSVNLLFKSKKLHQLEKKKAMKEEENIYQGLNLEDCCTTYDQIERSQAQGPYQDVCNVREEEEDMQLEKP